MEGSDKSIEWPYTKLEGYLGLQPDVGVKREFLQQVLGGVDWA